MVLFPMETEGPLSSPRGVCVCVCLRDRDKEERCLTVSYLLI